MGLLLSISVRLGIVRDIVQTDVHRLPQIAENGGLSTTNQSPQNYWWRQFGQRSYEAKTTTRKPTKSSTFLMED